VAQCAFDIKTEIIRYVLDIVGWILHFSQSMRSLVADRCSGCYLVFMENMFLVAFFLYERFNIITQTSYWMTLSKYENIKVSNVEEQK
jgi:hypothetical protein